MGTSEWFESDDFGFQVRGASLMDVFETAGMTMLHYEYDTSTVGYERELVIQEDGPDLDGLLTGWLRMLLQIRADGFIPGDLFVVEVGEPPRQRYGETSMSVRGSVRGRVTGDWLHATGKQVKDVGRCQVSRQRRNYRASVFLKR